MGTKKKNESEKARENIYEVLWERKGNDLIEMLKNAEKKPQSIELNREEFEEVKGKGRKKSGYDFNLRMEVKGIGGSAVARGLALVLIRSGEGSKILQKGRFAMKMENFKLTISKKD
jgi:hypothetical protein